MTTRYYPLRTILDTDSTPTGQMWDSWSGDTGEPLAWGAGNTNTKMMWVTSTTQVKVDVSAYQLNGPASCDVTVWWYDAGADEWTQDGTTQCSGQQTLTLDCVEKTKTAIFIELHNFSNKNAVGSVTCVGNRTQPGYNAQAALPPQKQ